MVGDKLRKANHDMMVSKGILPVPSTGGKLFVSREGVVYGMKGRPLYNNTCQNRYYTVAYRDVNLKSARAYVHRIVAEVFVPNPNGLKYVNHKDGDRYNNHADNLEYCTAAENMTHAVATGLCHNIPKKGQQGFQRGKANIKEGNTSAVA